MIHHHLFLLKMIYNSRDVVQLICYASLDKGQVKGHSEVFNPNPV